MIYYKMNLEADMHFNLRVLRSNSDFGHPSKLKLEFYCSCLKFCNKIYMLNEMFVRFAVRRSRTLTGGHSLGQSRTYTLKKIKTSSNSIL